MGLRQTIFLLVSLYSVCNAVVQTRIVRGGKSLTTTPLNTAARVGDTVVLECESLDAPPDARILWVEYITFIGGSSISENENLLGHPNRNRYRIIHETDTQFHLEISNLQMSDGGLYACMDSMSAQPDVWRGEAQLIVLDGVANCTGTSPTNGVVIETHNHTIECIVQYQGAFAPTMYWTGPQPFIQGGSTTPTAVWAGVAYTVSRTMDEGVFQCKTNFTSIGAMPGGTADNVPTYEHVFTTQPLTVFWGPMNTYVEPLKTNYEVGDVLTCSTDARPDAYYMWQNMRTLDIFADSPTYTFTEDLLGTNQSMRCQVQNIIHGFVYSDNIFIPANVPELTTPSPPTTTIPTTTPPAEAHCTEFTGHWRAESPYAELLIEMVPDSDIGEIRGIMKNSTDTIWVEVIGTARVSDWAYIGLSAIWPFSDGVTGMSGECHRCHGVEVIITDGMWRSVAESSQCGEGSTPAPYTPYRFTRVGALTTALKKEALSVWKPTKLSKHMGVQLK